MAYYNRSSTEVNGLGWNPFKAIVGAVKGLIGGNPVQAGPVIITPAAQAPIAQPPAANGFQLPGGNTPWLVGGALGAGLLIVLLATRGGRR